MATWKESYISYPRRPHGRITVRSKTVCHEESAEEISKLTAQEKKLLLELLKEKSINQLSIEWDIPYMTLKRRKDRIMKKLKEKLEK